MYQELGRYDDAQTAQTEALRIKKLSFGDNHPSVAATLNNIGPGFGLVGPTSNYAAFSWYTKVWFVWLMMIGRLEIYSILVLLLPGFWRNR